MSCVARTMYVVICDECGRRLREDGLDGWYMTEEDADLGGVMFGWNAWHRNDGTVRHICPECAERGVV